MIHTMTLKGARVALAIGSLAILPHALQAIVLPEGIVEPGRIVQEEQKSESPNATTVVGEPMVVLPEATTEGKENKEENKEKTKKEKRHEHIVNMKKHFAEHVKERRKEKAAKNASGTASDTEAALNKATAGSSR